ncbi:MAG: iron ABC transporter permease [Actinobacteria bacterium]|nr:iron ABC transporter permease [Actinomycetota bacterium]
MPSSKPSLTELREVAQPESVVGRANAEHWAGRLYMRHVSLYLTRVLVPTRVSADAVTWWMILAGVAVSSVAGAATSFIMLTGGERTLAIFGFLFGSFNTANWERTQAPEQPAPIAPLPSTH